MSEQTRNVGRRGSVMAAACVVVAVGALVTMQKMKKDIRQNEGQESVYRDGRSLSGGSDSRLNSSDVAAAVSGQKPVAEVAAKSRSSSK